MSERPKWHHRIPEATARWFADGHVVSIEHKWEFTGPDTSRHWLMLTRSDGASAEYPADILSHWPYELSFAPYHAGLASLRLEVVTTLREIDKWEKSNRRERSEYERLKKKFES